MSLLTLAERFEQRANEIYRQYPPSPDQLVTIRPGSTTANTNSRIQFSQGTAEITGTLTSRSRIKEDTRSLPLTSVARDTVRITQFLNPARSYEGVAFLGKQALLQTGNTFENTKLLNPLSFVANTVPFLHISRHIPNAPPRISGFLQTQTSREVSSNFDNTAASTTISKSLKGFARGVYNSTVALFGVGTTADSQISGGWGGQRPEFSAFATTVTGNGEGGQDKNVYIGARLYDRQPLTVRGTKRLTRDLIGGNDGGTVNSRAAIFRNRFYIDTRLHRTVPASLESPREKITRLYSKHLIDGGRLGDGPAETGGTSDSVSSPAEAISRLTRVQDPYNVAPFLRTADIDPNESSVLSGGRGRRVRGQEATLLPTATIIAKSDITNTINYDNIATNQPAKSDIVKFTFRRVGGDETQVAPVHFRALISNIKENIKPEFTEQRYVGRTERFVTYNGVKRTMDLSFNVVAFSGGESDGMWTRINYLTGLAFPTGVANGFMVPPLFKITIGGLYDEQPVYIDTLDYDFLDEYTTFDIEREIPFAINVKMRLTILEKRTKYYDSPFYKITEDADKYARINTPLTRTSTFDQSQGFNEAQQAAADARFEQELARGRTIRQFVGTPEEAALLAGQPERFRAIGTQSPTENLRRTLPGTPNLSNSRIEVNYILRRFTVETPKPPPPPPTVRLPRAPRLPNIR